MLNVNCFLYQPVLLAWGRINNPTETASSSYHTSTQGTKVVVEAIKGCGEFSSACHLDAISRVRQSHERHLKRLQNRN